MRIHSIRQRLLQSSMIGGAALLAASALPVAAVVLMPTAVSAQDYTSGTMTGVVTDQTGAPVSNATVTVRSNEQGLTRNLTTNETGQFRAALIPIGSYTVTIEAPGYGSAVQTAAVRLGSESAYTFVLTSGGATALDEIVVTGASQTLAFSQNTTGLVVDLEELVKTVPVGRSITAVTLLAPSTVQGDSSFGDVPSIGGSSVAENAFYVNGLNITNFDNYIGASLVPFDFYRSVEVKTGGYPAEFGRATGGIINAVTKSGSNDFTFAIRGNTVLNDLRENAPDTYSSLNSADESESTSLILEAGGPIIRDRLFFYGLAQFQDNNSFAAGQTGSYTYQEDDDPFYGLKIDGYITDDHRLEFTYFDTSREFRQYTGAYDMATGSVLSRPDVPTRISQGGESYVVRYTGQFTDWLTLSAAYGNNQDSNNTIPASFDIEFAQDSRTTPSRRVSPGQTANSTVFPRNTERTFYRADADVFFSMFGDHHVRMGYELEETSLEKNSQRTGDLVGAWIYRRAAATTPQAIGGNLAPGEDYVELNIFRSGGTFEGENEAFYIQDAWDVNDRLSLNLGVRLDKFRLYNGDGEEYVNFDEEIGPRVGFNYDLSGDGRDRVFGSYGVYYLPVASNTAFRQAGNELFYREYYRVSNGPDGQPYAADGSPFALGAQIVGWSGASECPGGQGAGLSAPGVIGCGVTDRGEVADTASLSAQNLESTQEEEFILGYERRFGDLWSASATVIYRDLLRNAEDVAIDLAVNAYCDREGIVGCDDIWDGFHQYVIVNPGAASSITLSDPLPGETTVRTVNFSAADLGYPKAERTYTALQIEFERAFDGVWTLQGSWTISESRGNTEGYVKSDNGQTDAGITQDFDQPGLTDGSNGLLPNHRGHVFKLFGSYQLTDNLLVGANMNISSPRKYGCLGLYPIPLNADGTPNEDDPNYLNAIYSQEYGAASYYCGGELTPRGTVAESDWVKQIDMSLRYNVPIDVGSGELVLRADVFNIFNFRGVTDINEFGEQANGDADPNFRAPIGYQTPRYVRLGFDLTF
ncbi:MAG: TonB-dependent receptor [Pseudomonadota bacterium]|nr:TonB-dependent receptor [Pseudomonadota bacterium]